MKIITSEEIMSVLKDLDDLVDTLNELDIDATPIEAAGDIIISLVVQLAEEESES